jgi:hypothetical protein
MLIPTIHDEFSFVLYSRPRIGVDLICLGLADMASTDESLQQQTTAMSEATTAIASDSNSNVASDVPSGVPSGAESEAQVSVSVIPTFHTDG